MSKVKVFDKNSTQSIINEKRILSAIEHPYLFFIYKTAIHNIDL
jgi:hypothetical protein